MEREKNVFAWYLNFMLFIHENNDLLIKIDYTLLECVVLRY